MAFIGMRLIALTVAMTLFLGVITMAFWQGVNSLSQALSLKKHILSRVMHHQTKETKITDFWQRPGGPANLHQCKPLSNKHSTIHATTRFAVVSMLTSDRYDFYKLSAIKLAKSLRWWFSPEEMDLVMLVTEGFGISTNIDSDLFFILMELQNAGWNIICKVPVIEHPNVVNTNRFHDFKVYSKLNIWALTEYDAILYLDTDTLVIRNPQNLFTVHYPAMKRAGMMLGAVRDRPERLSHSFNAGVLILIPTLVNQSWTFPRIVESISSVPHNMDWAEQDMLNVIYKDNFYELHFIYNGNLVAKLHDTYLWSQCSNAISIVHYTVAKGWMSLRHLSMLSLNYDSYKYFGCWYYDVDDFCGLWDSI
jgi:hypothetical protein